MKATEMKAEVSATNRRKAKKRTGAAMVELAIVLPLFLTIVLGIIEFGRALMVAQIVTNAAREGARDAILAGSTNTAVEQTCTDMMVNALGVPAGDVSVSIEVTPATGNPDPADVLANTLTSDLCAVTVTVPFSSVSYVAGKFLESKTLRGFGAMRHE